ncbi:hypothetical protein MKX01_009634 [Papaver californicum]|nr:hypothetical protein MKX01_009634 [Papaver californicum]
MEEGGIVIEKKEKRRDVRRFYSEFCGICRSKKSLIEEIEKKGIDEKEEAKPNNTCEECGASFQKPAHLKQHMQSHSLEDIDFFNGQYTVGGPPVKLHQARLGYTLLNLFERPFSCPVNDCYSSYKRKDHLNRHLLQHQGTLFSCPAEGCNQTFAYKGNVKRHIEDMHDDEGSSSSDSQGQTQHICQEIGCGKVFKYASRLRKHEESHVKLESVEAICCELDIFLLIMIALRLMSIHATNMFCARFRHMRGHEIEGSTERIKCSIKGCECTFKSNLNQHVKSVHFQLRPFVCRFPDWGQRFSFKHVRDNHEKSASHVYVKNYRVTISMYLMPGDFQEADEQFQTRPRGGRKRTCPTVETLLRKRVVPPNHTDLALNYGSEYLAWVLSADDD